MDNSVIVSLRDIVVEFDGQRILDGLNLDIHDDRRTCKSRLLYCAVILPCLVYLNQSLLKCQSLCQCLPKLYTPQQKNMRRSGLSAYGAQRFLFSF